MRRPSGAGQRRHGRHGSRLTTYVIALAMCLMVLFLHGKSVPGGMAVLRPTEGVASQWQGGSEVSSRAGASGAFDSPAAQSPRLPGHPTFMEATEQQEHQRQRDSELAASVSEEQGQTVLVPPRVTNSTTGQVKVAVLIPIWRDENLIDPLTANLSAHLDAQGLHDHVLHFVEQEAAQNFTPGLLVDVAFLAARRIQHLNPRDLIVYQQPTLLPLPGVSYALPSNERFMHLASAQSSMGYQLPYEDYCGGAWVMTVELFDRVRGLSKGYVGYEGLEDDLCRRVECALNLRDPPHAPLPQGRFEVTEDAPVLHELALLHRSSNEKLFRERWDPPLNDASLVAGALAGTAADGLHSLPEDWKSRFSAVKKSERSVWWFFGAQSDLDTL